MCGFAGWVGPAQTAILAARREQVEAAVHLLQHRGPDSRASLAIQGGESVAVMGAVRLRIIDLRPEADMPMTLPDGSATLVYNGELYNAAELRTELTRQDHVFAGTSDTECILHLYEEHRDSPVDLLRRLRGMFAFALWDPTRERLFAARDRLGIKPLVFGQVQDGLVFASETRALSRSGLSGGHLSDEVALNALRWGVVPGDETLIHGVSRLSAGGFLTWQEGAVETGRWWEPDLRPLPGLAAPDAAIAVARAVLTDAVARHLVAERPTGIFLSAGTDSLVLATLAARSGPVRALTLSFPDDPDLDETEPARRAAVSLGLAHEAVPVCEKNLIDLVREFLTGLDSPSMDGLNTWLVCRAAHQAGLVVALSGLGADELVGGYPTFRQVPQVQAAAAFTARLPAVARSTVSAWSVRRQLGGATGRLLEAAPNVESSYAAVRGLFSAADFERTDLPTVASSVQAWPKHPQDAVTVLELRHFLRQQLLPDSDALSMSHALEIRVPFLDDQVVAALLAIPADTRRRLGKRLLLTAAGIAEVPPKRPFALPMGRWLSGPLRPLLDEGLLSEALPFAKVIARQDRVRLHEAFLEGRVMWSRPWSVVVLRMWPGLNGLG